MAIRTLEAKQRSKFWSAKILTNWVLKKSHAYGDCSTYSADPLRPIARAKAEAIFQDKTVEELRAMANELSDGTTPDIYVSREAFVRMIVEAMVTGFQDGRADVAGNRSVQPESP